MQPSPLTQAAIEVAARILERRAAREAAEREQRRATLTLVKRRKGEAA